MNNSTYRYYLLVAMSVVSCLLPSPLFSQEILRPQDKLITAETSDSIQRGLNYLAEQQLENGSFGTSGYSRNVAVCALGGMAWLANGSTPGRGTYGEPLERCIEYLLENTNEQGFIAANDAVSRGPMYGHGFAVLFLCETYGMAQNPDLRDQLEQAVGLIINSQNEEGGWRYQPAPNDADISVTVCQVMALRAAKNAGFTVPRETIDRSMVYVKGCQNEDGGFRYMLNQTEQGSQFARSAAAVVAMYNAGIYEGAELQQGLDYLDRFLPNKNQPGRETFYAYGQYYAVQAMWHAGGERWQHWYPENRNEIISQQREDGSWMDSICPEYGTAMACIVLQVPNNYLPILQR